MKTTTGGENSSGCRNWPYVVPHPSVAPEVDDDDQREQADDQSEDGDETEMVDERDLDADDDQSEDGDGREIVDEQESDADDDHAQDDDQSEDGDEPEMVDEQDSDVDDDQSRLPDEVQPNAENHDRSGTDGSRTFNQRGFDEDGFDRDWNWDERRSQSNFGSRKSRCGSVPCRSYSIEIDSTNTARLRIISLTRHATLTKPPEEPPKVAEKPTSDPMVMALNAQSTALMKLSTAYASLAKWGLLAVAVLAVLILIRR